MSLHYLHKQGVMINSDNAQIFFIDIMGLFVIPLKSSYFMDLDRQSFGLGIGTNSF